MKKTILSLLLFCSFFTGKAQTKLSSKDTEEIRALARKKIQKSFPELMNTLNLDDVGEAERKNVVLNSYLPSTDQLFFNDGVIVEDDLNPDRKSTDKPIDLNIGKYFSNYDLFFKKSGSTSFEVSNVVVSDVKENNGLIYAKVFYRSIFKGQHKKITTPYQAQEREAEFRAEKIDKKWDVLITRIAFHIPEKADNKEINISKIQMADNDQSIAKEVTTIEKDTINTIPKTATTEAEKPKEESQKTKPSVSPQETVSEIEKPKQEPLVHKPIEEKKVILHNINNNYTANLETLQAQLSSYKGKMTILKILGIGSIGAAAGIYVLSTGKYSDYTAKVDQNNASYISWYKGIYGANSTPPSDELAKPILQSDYVSPSLLPAGAAAAIGIGLFLWGSKYGGLARETREKIESFQKNTSFVPHLDIPNGIMGFSISYKF